MKKCVPLHVRHDSCVNKNRMLWKHVSIDAVALGFAKLSTVSVYEGKKCLVKSGKDIVSKGQISAQNTYKKVSKDLFSGRFV